jgi:hypothetical protein
MKTLGLILLIIGFLGSATISVINEENVNWLHFTPLLIAGIIGVILLRKAAHSHKKCEHKLTSDINSIGVNLGRIVDNMNKFKVEKTEISVYDIHGRIDAMFLADLDNFAAARESIIHAYDMQSYADLMSHFAAGERYLNRSWSASADGYIDEAHTYIDKAAEQFAITLNHFKELNAS